jgi:hypothetical protein
MLNNEEVAKTTTTTKLWSVTSAKNFWTWFKFAIFLHLMQITVWRFLALMSTKERHLWAGFFTLKSVNAKFV